VTISDKATFEDTYLPTTPSIRVFGGLTAMDPRVLPVIPTSVVCIYFSEWISNLLRASQYVTGGLAADCSKDQGCSSIFLPGGLETARVFGQNLNATLLQEGYFNNSDAILLSQVPGIGVKFWPPPASFTFDAQNDCQILGQALGDGIKICITSKDSYLVVGKRTTSLLSSITSNEMRIGWTICPSDVYLHQTANYNCSTNRTWTESIDEMTAFSAYWQNATTAYAGQDFSILHVELHPSPQPYIIDPSLYRALWTKLFNDNTTLPEDLLMMNSFMFMLGWSLRLYQDRFNPDRQNRLNLLQNFLTIPLQFGTTAFQSANTTCQSPHPNCATFLMPQNLTANASSAQIQHQFRGKHWTMALFMAIGGAVVLWAGSVLGWILVHKDPLRFIPSGIPDLDSATLSGTSLEPSGRTFAHAAQAELPPNPGTWSARKFCKQKTLRVEKSENQILVLSAVGPANSHESIINS